MRIIAGRCKGLALARPKTMAIRPTSDRVRESLFAILQHGLGSDFAGARILDLFAGTGALGLEALSRGATGAVFVDHAVEARGLIRQNLERAGLGGLARVFRRDATKLGPLGTLAPFDLCFVDPPYRTGLGAAALASARAGGWLAPGALCVLEDDRGAAEAVPDGFTPIDRRIFGDTAVQFLVLEPAEPPSAPEHTRST